MTARRRKPKGEGEGKGTVGKYDPPQAHYPGLPGITIAAPSYKRAKGVSLLDYWPDVPLVVAESEAMAYRNEGHKVWMCPDSAQGNISRVRNWILDNSPTEQVLMVDDDLETLGVWNGTAFHHLSGEEGLELVEHGFQLARDLGVVLWGLNCVWADKGAYREYTPFALTSYLGAPFHAHVANPLRYDERLPLKEDYDMTLQVLNRFRKLLRFNMACYRNKMHTNVGGCASMRTIERERSQFDGLVAKWGPKIVRRDGGEDKVRRTKEKGYDLNPVAKPPIRGV